MGPSTSLSLDLLPYWSRSSSQPESQETVKPGSPKRPLYNNRAPPVHQEGCLLSLIQPCSTEGREGTAPYQSDPSSPTDGTFLLDSQGKLKLLFRHPKARAQVPPLASCRVSYCQAWAILRGLFVKPSDLTQVQRQFSGERIILSIKEKGLSFQQLDIHMQKNNKTFILRVSI